MLTQQATDSESSVVFNLRQLMQLEQDRLRSEADAVREQKAAAERERAERAAKELLRAAEREAAERAQQAELARQAERAELERQAVLLRVRLEAEAAERSAREHCERQHARELQAAKRTRAAILAGGLCLALVGATLAQRMLVTPSSRPAADSGTSALLATQARELELLRAHVSNLRARVEPPPATAPAVTPAAQSKPKPKPRPITRALTHHARPTLDGIDQGGDDPIGEL